MVKFQTGEVYHVFNKSIAEFKIFNNEVEFLRMINIFRYYKIEKPQYRFSRFIQLCEKDDGGLNSKNLLSANKELIKVIAYCLMPTHFHLVLKQLRENGISIFLNNALNSYSRYFNIKHNRKGPLWEGPSKRVKVKNDEQLLHLTRYVHLNPVTAYLVDKPEQWPASSYKEYIGETDGDRICDFSDILEIGADYKEFIKDNLGYQRELAKIKKLIFE